MNKTSKILAATEQFRNDPLKLLQACGGYYQCPKNATGNRLGHLVAYRDQYEAGKHYIGDVYANFSQAEQYPFVVNHYAACIISQLCGTSFDVDTFCGAPEGGKSLAYSLATSAQRRYIYPEKKGVNLIWKRHSVEPGERIAIVEDVCNNFSTTEKIVDMIVSAGGVPVFITCFLNRSPKIHDKWTSDDFNLPVISLVRKPSPEFKQHDPRVNDDVKRKNVIWEVKENWSTLMEDMEKR